MRLMMAASALSLAWFGSAVAAETIATTDGEAPGVKLDVQDLKTSNGVVTLKFTIVNDSDSRSMRTCWLIRTWERLTTWAASIWRTRQTRRSISS
ncbi:MAG TPA: hypothetical protein VF502_09360 [Stellaceae bacterium]